MENAYVETGAPVVALNDYRFEPSPHLESIEMDNVTVSFFHRKRCVHRS